MFQHQDKVVPGEVFDVFEIIRALGKPLFDFVATVAGNGWTGFTIIFVIFFAIFLLRGSALGKGSDNYARGLMYIGTRGFCVAAVYAVFLALDYILMPALALLIYSVVNLFTHAGPNPSELAHLILYSEGYRGELSTFYGNEGRLFMPLGPRATILICAAFATMFVVGRGLMTGGR